MLLDYNIFENDIYSTDFINSNSIKLPTMSLKDTFNNLGV